MKGDVISRHFLMPWFQKDSLDTIGFRTFRTFRGGRGSQKKIVDFGDICVFFLLLEMVKITFHIFHLF